MIDIITSLKYLRLIKSELIKLQKTAVIWLTIGLAIFVPLIKFIAFCYKWKYMIPKKGENPWDSFVNNNWQVTDMLLLPFFIILIVNLIVQIEHKSIAWKQLFVQPIKRIDIYLTKLIVLLFVIVSFLAISFISALGLGVLLGILRPQLGLMSFSPDYADLLLMGIKSFCSVLGIIGFQYLISLRFKNFAIPLGFGICGVISAQFLWMWEKSIYFFYTSPVLTAYAYKGNLHPDKIGFLALHELYSIIFFISCLVAGYMWDRKKTIVL